MGTGDAVLVEDAGGNDSFFGAGADYQGTNHLGQILMHVRDELRGATQTEYTPHDVNYYIKKGQQPLRPTFPAEPIIRPEPQLYQDDQTLIFALDILYSALWQLEHILLK